MTSNSTAAGQKVQIISARDGAGDGRHDPDLRSMFDQALPERDWASPRDRVVVALIDLRDWRPWLTAVPEFIDPAEIERIQRQRRDTDRQMLTLAYALHRLLLGASLNLNPAQVPLYRDERGCPRLRLGQVWTSLSHTDGFIALALCGNGPVGVDIELAGRAGAMVEIASHVCHPVETTALAGLARSDYERALLSLWVRKEAVLKAAGVGLAHEMSGFQAPERQPLPLPCNEGGLTHVRMLDVGPICMAAVAAPIEVAIACAWLRPGGASNVELRNPA